MKPAMKCFQMDERTLSSGREHSAIRPSSDWRGQIPFQWLAVLTEAVRDLDAYKSKDSFESRRSVLQMAMDVARDRRAGLTPASAAGAVK
jgi:hypothetical protein